MLNAEWRSGCGRKKLGFPARREPALWCASVQTGRQAGKIFSFRETPQGWRRVALAASQQPGSRIHAARRCCCLLACAAAAAATVMLMLWRGLRGLRSSRGRRRSSSSLSLSRSLSRSPSRGLSVGALLELPRTAAALAGGGATGAFARSRSECVCRHAFASQTSIGLRPKHNNSSDGSGSSSARSDSRRQTTETTKTSQRRLKKKANHN